jgi:hypothetical protein
MLFFRPHKPTPKPESDTADRTDTQPAASAPPKTSAPDGRHFYGFRMWPAILISILLWAAIIGLIHWLAR